VTLFSKLTKILGIPGSYPRSALLGASLFSCLIAALMTFVLYQVLTTKDIQNPVGTGFPIFAPRHENQRPKPRILVLNSYHDGYSWSDNEMKGIIETLEKLAPEIEPHIEHLDCKHYSKANHFPALISLFSEKYASQTFDLILAADNPALEFALICRPLFFPKVPIVFCGINGFDPSMLAGQVNLTGVAEILDAGTTLDLALRIQPGTTDVLVLHDYSVTGLSSRRETELQLKHFEGKVRIRFMGNLPINETIETLRSLKAGTIVLALSFSLDREGNVYDHQQIASLLGQQSPVPVYALHEERIGYGVLGGRVLGGREQGRRATEVGIDIIRGRTTADQAVDLKSPTFWMFDYDQLVRFGIPLDSVPSESKIVNFPVSFYDRHKSLVMAIMGLIVLLTLGLFYLVLNILERRVAENALSVSERKFRLLFESAADLIFIISPDGSFRQANSRACSQLGVSLENLLNLNISQFLPENHKAILQEQIRAPLQKTFFPLEAVLISLSGSRTPVELSFSSIEFEDGMAIMITARDLTERNRAEAARVKLQEELSQAQKMESIGYLAGGVAHDFNNLLTGIIGYAELAVKNTSPEAPTQRHLTQIKAAGEKAAQLTRQLLAFSRKQALQVNPLDLREVVKGMVELFKRILREDIELKINYGGYMKNVLADRTQIEQVLMNLIVNARDAMPEGGKLFIELKMAENMTRHRFEKPGEYLMLAVSDTGVGIPREIQGKIFEPFFTTKEVGKGTGLGLATVFGIVKQHFGHIYFYSEPGHGTTFKVYLPTTDSAVIKQETQEAETPHGTETILVVDDDPSIGKLIEDTLQALGYTLLVATNPKQAITIAENHSGTIDVLLSDLIMPEMNGKLLAAAISGLRPSIKVIFMSGYTDDIIAHQGILDPSVQLILKPISPTDLAYRLRKMIS